MFKLKLLLKRLVNSRQNDYLVVFNVFLLTGMIVSGVAFLITCFIAFDVTTLLCIGLIFLACIIALVIANKFKKRKLPVYIMDVIINLVVFPYLYFTAGGIRSGCMLWMLLGLILGFTIAHGKVVPVALFFINLIGPVTCVFLEYYHPEYVTQLSSELTVCLDTLAAFILVAVCIGAIYKHQFYIFDKQRKEVEEAARIANAATTAKSNFLSNMTHDIRTPMNAIIGYTEIARKNIDNRITLLTSLSNISISSEHLLSLVNDVLDMSRIESGKFELQNDPASILDIISKVEAIMKPEMEDYSIHFIVDTSGVEDDTISCDVLRLTQVLINVLSNAAKYSHPEGYVYLTVVQKQNPALDTIMCEIRIRDRGIGMSPDFIPHVFEPFTREKSTTVSGISGSGLGLSITKTLVEMMHGTISVRSELGKGSEFTIRIPFDVPTLVEVEPEVILSQFNFDGKRVLVVEDNQLNTDIVKEILIDVGCEVDTASDGTYAVEKVRVAEPGYYDVILMDVQMPIMDGYEATEIIRSFENKDVANVPIIALTANAFEADKIKSVSAGMNNFIPKPINSIDLLRLLNDLFKSEKK